MWLNEGGLTKVREVDQLQADGIFASSIKQVGKGVGKSKMLFFLGN